MINGYRPRCRDGNNRRATLGGVLISTSVLVLGTTMSSAQPAEFNETLELEGVTFHITSSNTSSLSPVKIKAGGLGSGDHELIREADGTVTGAQLADLDDNGSPELYIFTTSAGSGSYGGLIAYAVNPGQDLSEQGLSEIDFPPLDDREDAAVGYMGHDTFTIAQNTLVRSFPVYRADDTNASARGGFRQLHYQLESDDEGWVLRLVKVQSFTGIQSNPESVERQCAGTPGHSSAPPDQQQQQHLDHQSSTEK